MADITGVATNISEFRFLMVLNQKHLSGAREACISEHPSGKIHQYQSSQGIFQIYKMALYLSIAIKHKTKDWSVLAVILTRSK